MLKALPTGFDGLFVLQPRVFQDPRGQFVKTYHAGLFRELGLAFCPQEEFFSVSAAGVLRGMHFQLPPHAQAKLVYCVSGCVLDVMLDLRRQSPTRGQVFAREISALNREMLFIPAGFAHGFLALADPSVMVYQTNTVHSPDHDAGVLWNSFGFAWPQAAPLLSDRDQRFPAWPDFASPF
jgi:dTDP-4-dehydrorhamnose 3,5-epimerase